MYSKFSNEQNIKNPFYYPICYNCCNLIQIIKVMVNPHGKLILFYECKCTKKSRISFNKYESNLQIFYNLNKGKCKCGKKNGLVYCYECKVYSCLSCYLRHSNHLLFGTMVHYDILCTCNNIAEGKCETCNNFYCSMCLNNNHQNHKLTSFVEFYKKIQNDEFKFYNNINTNVEKLLENIIQTHKNEIKNSLNRLFLLIKESFIQSRQYPHYNIMRSLSNMKITKIEYEKILYRPKVRSGAFIFNDYLGRPPQSNANFFSSAGCLTKIQNNKIALYLNGKLQIYSENFQYLEFEEEVKLIYFILPCEDNILFLFGFGEIYQYTYTSTKKRIRKLYIRGKPSNDYYVKGIPLCSDIIIVMGKNGLYKWNVKKKTFSSLVKMPNDEQRKIIRQVKDNLFFFSFDNEKFIFYDVEKKKSLKNFIYSKTLEKQFQIIDCLLLGNLFILSVKDSALNGLYGKILIFSFQAHHLIHTFDFGFSEYIGNLIPHGNTSFIGISFPEIKIYVIDTEPCQIVTIYDNIYLETELLIFSKENDLLKYDNNQFFLIVGGRVICLIDPFDSNIKTKPCQARSKKFL